ncbi:MAG TPA: PIN domain-containing protein [Vicinamibacteria bacterium]|nr:PIN domain-containing protein [Vicinamibacteria bacterium]
MGALIDASILIAVERKQLDFDAVLAKHRDSDFALSAITASELLHGVHRASSEAVKTRREAYVEALLASLPVIAFDLISARVHARLSAKLSGKGAVIGAHDLLIASTALSRGMDVVTRDERSFPRIPGLTIVRW